MWANSRGSSDGRGAVTFTSRPGAAADSDPSAVAASSAHSADPAIAIAPAIMSA